MGATQALFAAHGPFRCVAALLAAALAGALALGSARAAATTDAAAPILTPWVSSQSYPSGPRFDPRLDADVTFWRAGLTLKEVFAGIKGQTGVETACWPPGDENERVRVALFLSETDPPSLRDVLVQIAWIADCSYATEDTGSAEAPYRYYLLSTSVADSAQARLEEDREAALAALRETWAEMAPREADISDKLDEYIAALDLSTEELFARYERVDDHLLAAMVDQPRRASVSFLASLDEESRDSLLGDTPLSLTWEELADDQQAALASCLRVPTSGFGGRGRRDAPRQAMSWTGAEVAHVQIFGLAYGSPMIAAALDPATTETRGGRGRFLMSPTLDLMGARDLAPDETAALRRARGELVSADDEDTMFREWGEARRDEMRTQWRDRARDAAEEKLSQELGLSPAVEEALSSFELPLGGDTPYRLWQIQEAVATATGLHIASDCFYQPARSLGGEAESLYPGEAVSMTALLALRLSAISTEDSRRLGWMPGEDHRAGWEWQDAGTFLRFRSRARDLWRAALLPPAATAYLDSWFESQLPGAVVSKDRAARMEVALEAEGASALAAGLTDLQFAHGGKLICGDPQDEETSYRQQLREAVLGVLYPASEALRALSGLSESQWALLREAGLRVTYDLTPDQRAAFNLEPRAREVSSEEARGPGGRGRGGRRLGPGGRRGGGRGPRGPGGFGPGPLRLEDDREMYRLAMGLSDESPYPARGRRGARAGDEAERRGGPPPGGRGWGRPRAEENDWLTFWVGDELRGALPLPRLLVVELALPGPSPLLAPGSAGGD